jgi:hypothetical protein
MASPCSGVYEQYDPWDVRSCSSVQARRRFGRTYSLYIQERRVSQKINPQYEPMLISSMLFTEAVLRNVGTLLPDYNAGKFKWHRLCKRPRARIWGGSSSLATVIQLVQLSQWKQNPRFHYWLRHRRLSTISLTSILMNITGFWDVSPYSLVNCYYRLEETFCCFFYPVDGGSRFLRNYETYLQDYTASYPRRQ